MAAQQTAVAERSPNDTTIIEKLIMEGDISKLSSDQRLQYYYHFCERLGLDPYSNSIQYLTLKNRLVLYITAKACDQLAMNRGISRRIVKTERLGDIYIVTAEASDASGRVEQSTGAMLLANGKGDALVGEELLNTLLKCETKAKRRAVIAFTGLGAMSEDEADSIPGAQKVSLGEVHGQPRQLASVHQIPANTENKPTREGLEAKAATLLAFTGEAVTIPEKMTLGEARKLDAFIEGLIAQAEHLPPMDDTDLTETPL